MRHSHRLIALGVVAVTLVLDFLAAVAYSHLTGIPLLPPRRGPFCGLDWAVATMTTTGDAGPPPVTRAQHWLWLGVHLSVIPLGAASISFFTSGLTGLHVRRAKEAMMEHVEARLKHHLGEPDSGSHGS